MSVVMVQEICRRLDAVAVSCSDCSQHVQGREALQFYRRGVHPVHPHVRKSGSVPKEVPRKSAGILAWQLGSK